MAVESEPSLWDRVISRADVDVLQRLTHPRLLRLMRGVHAASFTSARALEILEGSSEPASILKSATSRREVIDLLKRDEATDLCRRLSLTPVEPYGALHGARWGGRQLRLLLEFFGVALDEEQGPEESGALKRVEPGYALFGHQAEAARRCAEHLWRGRGRALLHMPTGSGKTRTAMTLVCEFLRRCPDKAVVWLAHSDELCEQAAEEFEKAWRHVGDRPVDLHRF